MLYPDETQTESLAYHLFGFQIDKESFTKSLLQHECCQQLEFAAWRLYLVDSIRYRVRLARQFYFFPPDFRSEHQLTYQLVSELGALQLYLLCTCIDTIAGKDFITFEEWLNINSDDDKTKYQVDDQKIASILNESESLNDPDMFRKAARKIYDKCYIKSFGNHKAFLGVFTNLPMEIKHLLGATYFISKSSEEDPLKPKIVNEEMHFPVWDEAYREWKSLEIDSKKPESDSKIKRIADYFYTRRNLYTHRATGKRVLSSDSNRGIDDDPFMQYLSTDDIVEEKGKYKIVAFRAKNNEDEPFILRLVVIAAWLTKLYERNGELTEGEHIDGKHIESIRWLQMRREMASAALQEAEKIQMIFGYYNGQSENESNSLYLQPFPTIDLTALRPYLLTSTPNEKSVDQLIGEYITGLEYINTIIDNFNVEYIQPHNNKDGRDFETIKRYRTEVYQKICGMEELRRLKSKIRGLFGRINDTIYRMPQSKFFQNKN